MLHSPNCNKCNKTLYSVLYVPVDEYTAKSACWCENNGTKYLPHPVKITFPINIESNPIKMKPWEEFKKRETEVFNDYLEKLADTKIKKIAKEEAEKVLQQFKDAILRIVY